MADYLVTDKDLESVADSIRAKGGTAEPLLFPAEFVSAVDSITSGAALPELTTPAVVGHVLAGKEYIDGNGDKKSGTLVVCDSVVEVEHFGIAGTGVSLEIQSTADRSDKTMTLPEENLKPENIRSGVSIFGILGSAAGGAIESASGTFTLSEDAQAPAVIHNLGVVPDLVIVEATDHDNTPYSIFGFVAVNPALLSCTQFGGTIFIINVSSAEGAAPANNNGKLAFEKGLSDTGFVCAYNSGNYKYRAGWTYKWKVFAGLT